MESGRGRVCLLVLLLSALGGRGLAQDPMCNGAFEMGCASDGVDCDYRATWQVRGDEVLFHVIAQTTGWVGIGFSETPSMINSDVIVGASGDTNPFVDDRYVANTRYQPHVDSVNDIIAASIAHTNGVTEMSFRRLRDTGDVQDTVLDSVYLIFAWGGTVDFGARQIGIHALSAQAVSPNIVVFPNSTSCPSICPTGYFEYIQDCVQTCPQPCNGTLPYYGIHVIQTCTQFEDGFEASLNATGYSATVVRTTSLETAVINFAVVIDTSTFASISSIFMNAIGNAQTEAIFKLNIKGSDGDYSNIAMVSPSSGDYFGVPYYYQEQSVLYVMEVPDDVELPAVYDIELAVVVVGLNSQGTATIVEGSSVAVVTVISELPGIPITVPPHSTSVSSSQTSTLVCTPATTSVSSLATTSVSSPATTSVSSPATTSVSSLATTSVSSQATTSVSTPTKTSVSSSSPTSVSSPATTSLSSPVNTSVSSSSPTSVSSSASTFSILLATPTPTSRSTPENCDSEREVTNRGNYTWPESRGGTDVIADCAVGSVSGTEGVAVRSCLQNGEWEDSDLSQCITIVESQLEDLEERITNEAITEDNYEEIVDELDNIITEADTPDEQTSDIIGIVSEVLSSTAALVSSSDVVVSETTVEESVQIVDTVKNWPAEVIQEETNEIVQSLETITAALVQQENFTTITVVTEDIAFAGEQVFGRDVQKSGRSFTAKRVNGVLDPRIGNESTHTLEDKETVTVFLHQQLFQEFDDEGDVAVAFTVYDNPDNLFPVQSTANETSGKVTVIGTAVIGILIPGKENVQNLPQPVEIQLRNDAQLDNRTVSNVTCVFWDFTRNDAEGGWSDEGCVMIGDNLTSDVITCQCDHLTNFAALVDICSRVDGCDPIPPGLALVLDIISIIGVSFSLFGLITTVIILLVSKKFRKRDATKFNVQLCIAIFCMMLVFVVGIDRTEVYGGCVAVSALIHYFTLAAVMWMGASAILMFQKLVIVFTEITTKYIIAASIICWTLPIIPVVVPLAIDRDFMVTFQNQDTPEQTLDFCFIGNTAVFFGAFIGPIFAIILFNCVVFVAVISVLIRHLRSSMKKGMDCNTAGRLLFSIIGVMSLFGLTWLFGALTVTGATIVFQILFAVFNSFQGFFIFLFFCVFSKDARELWKETLTCGRYKTTMSRKPSGSGSTLKRSTRTSGTYTTPKSEFDMNTETSHMYQRELSSFKHSTKATDHKTALDHSDDINPATLIVKKQESCHESSPVNAAPDLVIFDDATTILDDDQYGHEPTPSKAEIHIF